MDEADKTKDTSSSDIVEINSDDDDDSNEKVSAAKDKNADDEVNSENSSEDKMENENSSEAKLDEKNEGEENEKSENSPASSDLLELNEKSNDGDKASNDDDNNDENDVVMDAESPEESNNDEIIKPVNGDEEILKITPELPVDLMDTDENDEVQETIPVVEAKESEVSLNDSVISDNSVISIQSVGDSSINNEKNETTNLDLNGTTEVHENENENQVEAVTEKIPEQSTLENVEMNDAPDLMETDELTKMAVNGIDDDEDAIEKDLLDNLINSLDESEPTPPLEFP
jgi:hypothetical protein